MRDLNVHDVVFAWGARTDDQTIALVRHCQEKQYQVFVMPRFFEVMGLDRARRVEVVSDVSLVRLRRWAVRPGSMFVKRAIDIAASAAGAAGPGPAAGRHRRSPYAARSARPSSSARPGWAATVAPSSC